MGVSEKECLPAVRLSKYCIGCVASSEKLVLEYFFEFLFIYLFLFCLHVWGLWSDPPVK